MQNSGVLESDVPMGESGVHPALDLPNRFAEGFLRHLTEWYAFCFYTLGLGIVAYLLVPGLLSNEVPKPGVACRQLTTRVVEAAAFLRRQNSTASLDVGDGGPISQRFGGKIPTCPDGGHVEFLANGTPVQIDGVPTIVTAEYIAGVCVRPDGERCHPEAILARVHPLETYLDGVVRPDSKIQPWTEPSAAPKPKPAVQKPQRKKKAKRTPLSPNRPADVVRK